MSNAEAAADFAIYLLKLNNKAESFVFSPFSLGAALSIIHAGAGGKTKEEVTQVLLKGASSEEVATHYKTLLEQLEKANGEEITVEAASKFFLRNSINLKEDYKKTVSDDFKASAENYDFGDSVGSAKEVNGYVDEKTHGKISKLVDASLFTDDLMAILINAVYFKGLWQSPFSKHASEEKDFHAVSGDRKETFMMKLKLKVQLNFDNEDVKAIALPYKNTAFRMWFFLPKEGVSLQDWIKNTNGAEIVGIINGAYNGKCNVELPKFKIESKVQARDQLVSLGMKEIFSDRANLSGVTADEYLKVSQVIHKAVIEVNEEGAEAAAATGLVARMYKATMIPKIPENVFVADRPFAYAITHQKDILFMGSYH